MKGYLHVFGRFRFLWHLLSHAFTWGHRGHAGMRCSCGWGVIDVNETSRTWGKCDTKVGCSKGRYHLGECD